MVIITLSSKGFNQNPLEHTCQLKSINTRTVYNQELPKSPFPRRIAKKSTTAVSERLPET